jgi:hypothetical protein
MYTYIIDDDLKEAALSAGMQALSLEEALHMQHMHTHTNTHTGMEGLSLEDALYM